jgi:hypothetical protein
MPCPLRSAPVLLAALPALALGGCIARPPIAAPAPQPRFDVLAFFSGPTLGTGRLHKLFSKQEATLVHGTGHVEGDTLVLDQDVVEGNKPSRHRQWRIRQDAPGHFTGTLTDASGPVTATVEGNRLHIAFTMKGGFPTQQWLTLAPDGRSAHNVMIVTKLGVTVATLTEEIRKTD